MSAAHTPGPWVAKWSKYREGEFIVQTEHASKRVLATFDGDGDGPDDQSIADARLIAAAPALLDVAIQLEESLTADGYESVLVRDLRAAISLATGEAK